jgi:predicted RNA methylase
MFEYNENEKILVTRKTVDYGNNSFKRNTEIWEKYSLNYFFNLIDKNKKVNIIDIGANVGLYSLYAKHLPNSHFYSYEPFKFTYDLLNDNIKLNNITNVQTYNIGLSDKKGSPNIYL